MVELIDRLMFFYCLVQVQSWFPHLQLSGPDRGKDVSAKLDDVDARVEVVGPLREGARTRLMKLCPME